MSWVGDTGEVFRRGIMFLLGVGLLIGAFAEDPVHLTSLFIGLLLMGVITWDQVSAIASRSPTPSVQQHPEPLTDDTPTTGTSRPESPA